MTRRVAVALLTRIRWAPPGIDAAAFRAALAEDLVDLLATLAEVEPAIAGSAADRPLADAVAWPGTRVYELDAATPREALRAAALDGYDQAVVLAADAPDLPGLIVAKLLAPLTTRTVALAPATDGDGLVGVAARLPVPDWLPDLDLDTAGIDDARRAAPRAGTVAAAPGWHRLRGPEALTCLDPALEGWETTRALLGG